MMGYGSGMGAGGWIALTIFWVGLITLTVWALSRALPTRGSGGVMIIRPPSGLWVPLVTVLAMLGSGVWLATQEHGLGRGFGSWGGGVGGPMMGGNPRAGWLAGDGDPVDDLAEARARAGEYAGALAPGLRVGEVMRFTNNYYAELEESNGTLATELLVEPRTGAVQIEFGPAMMWNTRYGMMTRPGAAARVSAERVQDIARRWANDRRGLSVADPDAFPGYYTLHTLQDGRIEGMLSVNAFTGAVWYHSWHGEFQEMSEGG